MVLALWPGRMGAMSVLQTQLAPGLLVAAPGLPDPNFTRTVVFLMEHTEGGAMGLVINRSLKLPLGKLLQEVGLGETARFTAPVLYGGPVSPARGWVVHDADWTMDGSLVVAEGV
ncbi:MAG: YqgE/AlgH family protein, partial [Deltaproteobacteria bacterium]|nr:YqgE/AlgH family protein [Deltaproteobacteria bacterium]